jgi:hypothetical protein
MNENMKTTYRTGTEKRGASRKPVPPEQIEVFPKTVPLPDVPENGSPVPWLTSIHGTPGRGDYGDASYRGNCSGLLIKDLLQFYDPRRVADSCEGSGTCRDVCQELGIDYFGGDLKRGFDATDPTCFQNVGTFDFIWFHPPYWKMVV